jgi:hypothetical protein
MLGREGSTVQICTSKALFLQIYGVFDSLAGRISCYHTGE